MIAFFGDPTLKSDILAELDEHRAHDQIVKGTYGEGTNGDFRACGIGCSIHSLNRKRGTKYSTSDHAAYEDGFGIPQMLARLEDELFENLPGPLYLNWPKRFMGAIRPGSDLSLVGSRFMYWLLIDPNGIRKNARPDGLVAIDVIAKLYERRLHGEVITDADWSSAESAAWSARSAAWSARGAAWSARSAAESAWSAARSAAESAAESARSAARSAAWSAGSAAWSARSAAESAAWSAESAAWSAESAAWSAAYVRMADKLIKLLEAA